MSVETVGAVEIRRVVKAEPQAVWDAWTQPEQMKKWSCPAPRRGEGDHPPTCGSGGAFEIHMEVEEGTHTAFGVYREIDAPRRIV